MRYLQITLIGAAMGVLVFGFAFASIPYGDVVRWVISLPAWIAATTFVWMVMQTFRAVPGSLHPLTCTALIGWMMACLIFTTSLSFWEGIFRNDYRTPDEWMLCRAIIGGFILAIVPTVLVFRLAERACKSSVLD